MSISEIRKLPLREKFQILEALQEDLGHEVVQSDISEEHKQLLDERRERVESGQESLLDWEEIKHSYGQK
jgi:hypothetical protein